MLILAAYALPPLAVFLPAWLGCALVPPLLVVTRLLVPEEDLLRFGPATVYPLDGLIGLLVLKWLLGGGLARRHNLAPSLVCALGAWITLNVVATLLAGAKFGESHLIGCASPLARVVADALLMLVMADAIASRRQARAAAVVLLLFLAGLMVLQFINFGGARVGLAIGEVQGIERDMPRVFGPVGDSVGFVLLLGYLYALCRESVIGAAAFAGSILVTAGLGAVLAMTLATLFYLAARPSIRASGAVPPGNGRLILGAGIALALACVFGGALTATLRERLDGQHEESGGQRLDTVRVALAMIDDNLWTGVGFMGFRLSVERYGGRDFFDLDVPDGATANANNQILQSLADAGIVGLIGLAALVYCAARVLCRAARRAGDPLLTAFLWAVFLWLLAQAFGNLASTWLTPSSFVGLLFWIGGGVALGVERLADVAEEAAGVNTAEAPRRAELGAV